MKTNNLSRPPENRPSLELSVFYDEHSARINFEENITVLSRTRSGELCLAGFECSPEKLSDIFDLKKMTDKEKENLSDIIAYDIEDLEDLTIKELSYRDIIALLSTFETDFNGFISRGYSQGDSCVVIFKDDNKPSKKFVDHLFWDCPVYICLEIDGQDHYLEEFLKDPYEYNKAEILENCKNEFSEYVYKWLSENLPEEVSYF